MKLIIRMIAIIVLVNFCLYGLGPASIGKLAPDFTLKELKSGKNISLKDYRGKIVILDFWASWCSPCGESLPELAKIDSENHTLKVLAVNVDDQKESAIKFLNKFGLNLSVPYDEDGNVVKSYEIPAMPTAIIIDQKGVIRYLHIGYNKNHLENIQKEIEEIR
jgi:thiol-disulfide isomerase/thioredoxin